MPNATRRNTDPIWLSQASFVLNNEQEPIRVPAFYSALDILPLTAVSLDSQAGPRIQGKADRLRTKCCSNHSQVSASLYR